MPLYIPTSPIVAASATSVPLTIQGASGQSSDLTEWVSSSGSVLANIDAAGNLTAQAIQAQSNINVASTFGVRSDYYTNTAGTTGPYIQTGTSTLTFVARAATDNPMIVKGASSQSADLAQFQDSTSAVKAAISATGGFSFSPTTQTTSPAAGGAGALPATPAGYANVTINGTVRKVAYY